jgi:outer membrane protein
MEEKMHIKNLVKTALILSIVLLFVVPGFGQKFKVGYVHTQKILSTFKDAVDVNRKVEEIDRQYQAEGREMQENLQTLQEQYQSQSLLLSDAKKREKEQEIQNLVMKLQNFQREKYDPQTGEIFKKQSELLQPVYDKINTVIKKIGEDEKYDMILDTASGNILHVSDTVTDLTDKILEELNKGGSVKKN